MKCIIFDFDGTMANTNKLIIENIKIFVEENKIEIPKNYRDYSLRELLELSKIHPLSAFAFARKMHNIIGKNIENINLFPGIKEAIEKMKEKYTIGIVTSNSKKNVLKLLQRNGINGCISFIEGGNTLLGKDHKIKKIIKKGDFLPNEVLYIGDEVRDIIAGKKAKTKTAGVAWGINSKTRLKEENPDFFIENVSELLEI